MWSLDAATDTVVDSASLWPIVAADVPIASAAGTSLVALDTTCQRALRARSKPLDAREMSVLHRTA